MTVPLASRPFDPVSAMTGRFERFGIAALRLATPIASCAPGGSPPPASRSTFRVGGQDWAVILQPEDGAFRITVSADFGVLPYTAENPQARAAMLRALPALTGLPLARIALTPDQRLRVIGDWHADGAMTPLAVLYELLRFLTEARPVGDLLRRLQAG